MAKKADRYTMLVCHTNELPKIFKAINALQMHWFCVKSSITPDTREVTCDVYVFFDRAGLDNYLTGVYGSMEADIRKRVWQVKEGEITAAEAISLIEDMLDY